MHVRTLPLPGFETSLCSNKKAHTTAEYVSGGPLLNAARSIRIACRQAYGHAGYEGLTPRKAPTDLAGGDT